jgi:hypothetical protein
VGLEPAQLRVKDTDTATTPWQKSDELSKCIVTVICKSLPTLGRSVAKTSVSKFAA